MNETMIERIRSIMDYAKLSQQDFAARLGISPASLSSILTGRTNPTNKHVMGVHVAFPEINVNWLMFGEGEMLVNGAPSHPLSGDEDGALDTASEIVQLESATSNVEGVSSTDAPFAMAPDVVDVHNRAVVEPRAGIVSPRREQRIPSRGNGNMATMGINIDKDERKIKEIRVFYSNGTYESFVPSNK